MKQERREGAKQFYNSKAWIKCRDGYMQSQNYLCERCGGMATICHHKTWLDETKYSLPEYSLNWDNLEAVCQTCHNQEHFSSDIVSDGLTFDSKGNVIKIN